MKISKGMTVAFWHNGDCTIYEGKIVSEDWEIAVCETEKMALVAYTNNAGRQRKIYLTAEEMTELPTLERTQKLADQFFAIFR